MAYTEKLPGWVAPGIEPPQSLKNNGWGAGDYPAAAHLNYVLSRLNAVAAELQNESASEEWVNEQIADIGITLTQDYNSTDPATAISGDAVRRGLETKQNILRLADNYKAPTAAITEYPEGYSVFYVGGGTGGQGSAWATAAGATEQSGFVETIRTGNAGYQTFTEMYSGVSTTDTLSNRQFKRVKRDSNSFWQPFEKELDADDLAAHNADYIRQPGYAATSGTGAAYTVTLSPAPAALVNGLAITIVPHADNTAADPTLKIGSLSALPIRRQSGAQFAAGSIKAGQPLSLIKVGSYFLARSAAPIGNATAAQVLAGYTFQSAAVPDGGPGTLVLPTPSSINTNYRAAPAANSSTTLFTMPAGTSLYVTARITTSGSQMIGFTLSPSVALPYFAITDGTTEIALRAPSGSTLNESANSLFLDLYNSQAYMWAANTSGIPFNSINVSLSGLDKTKPLSILVRGGTGSATTIAAICNWTYA